MPLLSRSLLVILILTLIANGPAQQSSTSVPNLIRYGGVLKDAQGTAMAARTVGMTFLIYGQQEGGAPVWLETQNVATDAAGQYNVLLGSTTATGLPSDLFAQQEQRWLAVKAEGQPEQPRVLLVSVPYAMKAAEADRLAGHSVSEFVTTDNLQSAVQCLQGQATAISAGTPTSTSGKGTAPRNAPVPTNTATNFVDNTSNQVVQVQQNGTGFGLSASSLSSVGVLGTVSSGPQPGIVAGVEGTSSINNGFGMFGYSTATTGGIGVQGRSDGLNGIGLRGFIIGTSGVAVQALSNATSGNAVGLYASVSAPGGTGALITNIASGTITGPLINATTNNGTQFVVGATGNVVANGWLSGRQLMSTVATGTAPLQVASTTLVPNLNASLLGGRPASAFALANGSPNYIQSGTAVQASAGFNISGTGTANNFNSATAYQIGGSLVLSIGSAADANLFLGTGAGASNVGGQGAANTFSGAYAGTSNTTGSTNTAIGFFALNANTQGSQNTATGGGAMASNTTGVTNTANGFDALFNNTIGSGNVAAGSGALFSNTIGNTNTATGTSSLGANKSGSANTANGASALHSNTSGNNNTASGGGSLYSNTSGMNNVAIGYNAMEFNVTGSNNIAIGSQAGLNLSGANSNNIHVGSQGLSGDNGTIRIGDPINQSAAYIAGIYGNSPSGALPVVINANGQLGTTGGTGVGVTSFNGRTGAVVPAANDYSFSQLSGTLGSFQLSGAYANALTLNNTSNSFTGSFSGDGAGLTGMSLSQLSGTLGSSQLSGTYTSALTLNNTSNSFTGSFSGNGAGLTGVSLSQLSGTLGSSQLSGTYTSALTLNNTSNSFTGSFSGNGAGLKGVSFFQLKGTLRDSQFSGTYTNALTLNNTSNSFTGSFSGDGAGLTGVPVSAGSPNYIRNGTPQQPGADFNISGNGSANSFNSATTYGIGGSSVVSIGSPNDFNLFLGVGAGSSDVSGQGTFNTLVGFQAGYFNTTGAANTFLGYLAGINNIAGGSNVYIANQGPNSGTESNTIRIGTQGNNTGLQDSTYIAGIYSATIGGSGIAVYVDSNGQLGTIVSSRRFKEQIRDMGDSSNALIKLRPVTFLYRPEYDKGPRTLQYGLIAEEVAEVYPDLVAYEADGKPYTVKYQYLTTMLLNEMQKQYHRAEVQAEVIKTQQQEIDGLKAQFRLQNAAFQERLVRLESMVGTRTQIAADLPHQ